MAAYNICGSGSESTIEQPKKKYAPQAPLKKKFLHEKSFSFSLAKLPKWWGDVTIPLINFITWDIRKSSSQSDAIEVGQHDDNARRLRFDVQNFKVKGH